MNLNRFTDESQVQTLFTLVPTLLVLFGSWYRVDIFFDVKKKKSEQELLEELLQEVRNHNCEIFNGSMESGNPANPADGDRDDMENSSGGKKAERKTKHQPNERTPLVQINP